MSFFSVRFPASKAILWIFAASLFPVRAGAAEAAAAPEPETVAVSDTSGTDFDAVANSVVKIFATVRYPDVYRPWTKRSPQEISGTGVVSKGRRILSNAHIVKYASRVEVQANQSGKKLSATVEALAPGIDLAVLKLDDDSFFDDHPPLPRAEALPEIRDVVMAYGYPKGGTSLSITKGIVSRIEFVPYDFDVFGLRVQIDAAINSGNSGGPAIVGDKMIGLAFSHLGKADNIGYIIPNEEIDLFLRDIADGRYDGKPGFFADLQTLENPALRAFLKLDKSVEGIVVREPDTSDPANPLKAWDVITRIGDTPVDQQGMVKVGNLRVRFSYLIQHIARDGKVPLTVVREGKPISLDLPVHLKSPLVIPDIDGTYPSHFIFGPIVFSGANESFVRGLTQPDDEDNWISSLMYYGSPLLKRRKEKPAFEGEELVLVSSPFFPHKLAKGYSNPMADVVKTLNGIPIKNLGHLVQVLRDSRDEFLVIEFDARIGETLVFKRAELNDATEEILNDNGIRSQGSPDMMAIWEAKPARH